MDSLQQSFVNLVFVYAAWKSSCSHADDEEIGCVQIFASSTESFAAVGRGCSAQKAKG